ncbi:MAG: M81 family metallopeptidase [Rhodospirillales bacterium]|jgi:microcystin degradation protein MlrC|nr:M81 family metallopeptidase [Rhodospirillales bacterium]
MRIACLMFVHETVTFLANTTTIEDFTYQGSPAAGEALLDAEPRSYMGGFVQVAREYPDVQLVGIESPLWPRTGSGSGWVTREAFEHFTSVMTRELRAQGPFDGVFMALHGAMAVEGVARPEAELARRVREAVGPHARLAATFDPHGNEDAQFLRHAELGFTVKYFPHYDGHLQGQRAARTLVRAIRGAYSPVHAVVKVPILTPTVMQWTGASPWMDLIQRALVWEAREPDLYVNVFFGFPWSDVPDAGMTIQAIANVDHGLAHRAAVDVADFAWRRRKELVRAATIHSIRDGVRHAAEAVSAGKTPVVLADHSDRSGHATWLLRELLGSGLRRVLVATVADPAAVDAAVPGQPFDRDVGGRVDESAGEPVRITGRVVARDESRGRGGSWARIDIGGGSEVVVSRYLTQIIELEQLREMGIEPGAFDVIAIKSRVHFRRGFDDSGFASTILLVEPDEPFLGTVRLEALPYRHLEIARFYPYGDPSGPELM